MALRNKNQKKMVLAQLFKQGQGQTGASANYASVGQSQMKANNVLQVGLMNKPKNTGNSNNGR